MIENEKFETRTRDIIKADIYFTEYGIRELTIYRGAGNVLNARFAFLILKKGVKALNLSPEIMQFQKFTG